MNVYKIPIEYAFIVFPFVAFILTIPFLIHQYRKFGSIPVLKSTIFYSMILYLICSYFLVILPLPSIEKVKSMTGPTTQLVPFQFIKDIISTVSFDISNVKDFINIFKQSTVYVFLFNLFLILPFGVYLRYMFKKKWYHSLIYSFLLSIFFELTQLSGLYGIYPRAYRLFDVDDLIVNTCGGLIGHILAPYLTFFIPSIDELEAKGYKKGKRVTLIRRFVSLVIDVPFVLAFCVLAQIFLYGTSLSSYGILLVIVFYYIVAPTFTTGKTIGKKVIKTKITSHNEDAKWYLILIRNTLLVFIVLYPFSWINILAEKVSSDVIARLWSVIIILQVANIIYYIYTVLSQKEHAFLYEYVTQTINTSTIEYVEKEPSKSKRRKKKLTKDVENVENIGVDNCVED